MKEPDCYSVWLLVSPHKRDARCLALIAGTLGLGSLSRMSFFNRIVQKVRHFQSSMKTDFVNLVMSLTSRKPEGNIFASEDERSNGGAAGHRIREGTIAEHEHGAHNDLQAVTGGGIRATHFSCD